MSISTLPWLWLLAPRRSTLMLFLQTNLFWHRCSTLLGSMTWSISFRGHLDNWGQVCCLNTNFFIPIATCALNMEALMLRYVHFTPMCVDVRALSHLARCLLPFIFVSTCSEFSPTLLGVAFTNLLKAYLVMCNGVIHFVVGNLITNERFLSLLLFILNGLNN